MQPLPVRISPDPLLNSTAELRFEPLIDRKAVFGRLYAQLRDQFPELTPLSADEQAEADPQPMYAPQYRLANARFAVYIGEQILVVGVLGAYPGWAAFREVVSRVFGLAHAAGVVGAVERLSVRYVSFFADNILPQLTLRLTLPGYEASQAPAYVQVQVPASQCTNFLAVAWPVRRADLTGEATGPALGTTFDIDTRTGPLPADFFSDLGAWLDVVHLAETQLFFSLLTADFLASLAPEYA